MQPQKDKPIVGLSLLERLLENKMIEFKMEFQGFWRKYEFIATNEKKIYVSFSGNFLGVAMNIEEAINTILIMENKPRENYDASKIITTYVYQEEIFDRKLKEELLPKKINHSNGLKMFDKQFYIVKKSPDGKSLKYAYCIYNFDTRNLLWAHWDKAILIGWLMTRYQEIEHLDI